MLNAAYLLHTVTITRRAVSYTADSDQAVVPPITEERRVAALVVPIQASDEDLAVGPMPMRRVRIILAADTDVKDKDKVTVDVPTADDRVFTVDGPPQEFTLPDGTKTHVEAIAVQEPIK